MILYISKRSKYDIGSVTHFQALKDIYGEENVIYIDFNFSMPPKNENIGVNKNKVGKKAIIIALTKPAPEEMPIIPGSARGFFKTA